MAGLADRLEAAGRRLSAGGFWAWLLLLGSMLPKVNGSLVSARAWWYRVDFGPGDWKSLPPLFKDQRNQGGSR